MEYLRSTGTSGGLLFGRTQSGFVRETAGDLLRAASLADAAVGKGADEAVFRVKAVRELVLACVGVSWMRENVGHEALFALQNVKLVDAASKRGAVEFDRLCSTVLRARFPVETEQPPAGRNSRSG